MRCPYCRHEIQALGTFCPRCGREIFGADSDPQEADDSREPEAPQHPQPAAPSPFVRTGPRPALASGHVIGKTCPFDQYPISMGDEIVTCPECGTPHHADCWQENHGCTTYGCAASPAVREAAQAPRRPPYPATAHSGHSTTYRPPAAPPPVDRGGAIMAVMAAEIDQRAGHALIYSLLGLTCCPVLSIIGFFMAISVLGALTRLNGETRLARIKANWALVLGALAPVLWIVFMVALSGTESGY